MLQTQRQTRGKQDAVNFQFIVEKKKKSKRDSTAEQVRQSVSSSNANKTTSFSEGIRRKLINFIHPKVCVGKRC